jgi:S-adenosylhomocysteine hydrolase
MRRYYGTLHGTLHLDSTRVVRDAGRIADKVIAHLVGHVDAEVKMTLEIEASLPAGASEQIDRIVTKNGRTLKFISHGFES